MGIVMTIRMVLLFVGVTLAVSPLQPQAIAAPEKADLPVSAITPFVIPGAVQVDLPSRITGRTYRIYLQQLGIAPNAGWPVVYVLDGDATFAGLASQNLLRIVSGESGVILVGIAYPNGAESVRLRMHDLTPSPANAWTLAIADPGADPKDAGGAEAFHRFMMEELRPWITSKYPVNAAAQTLMGYSLGGLFALHVLFHHPEAYRTFVAGSPSIWWNNRELLLEEPGFVEAVRSGRVAPRILITSDGWEQNPPSFTLPSDPAQRAARMKTAALVRMVDNARDLAHSLDAFRGSLGYEVHYLLLPEETHDTGEAASITHGFNFALTP
jgi:predicted alpha/beta superfamily hydrolase